MSESILELKERIVKSMAEIFLEVKVKPHLQLFADAIEREVILNNDLIWFERLKEHEVRWKKEILHKVVEESYKQTEKGRNHGNDPLIALSHLKVICNNLEVKLI